MLAHLFEPRPRAVEANRAILNRAARSLRKLPKSAATTCPESTCLLFNNIVHTCIILHYEMNILLLTVVDVINNVIIVIVSVCVTSHC